MHPNLSCNPYIPSCPSYASHHAPVPGPAHPHRLRLRILVGQAVGGDGELVRDAPGRRPVDAVPRPVVRRRAVDHPRPDFPSHHGFFQRLEHISAEILRVLDAAADADQIVPHARLLALRAGDPRVRHAARDFDQTLDPAEALGQGEDLRGLAEALGRGGPALDAEREHAAAHAVAVLLDRDRPLRVRRQAGVVDGQDVRRGGQRLGHDGRVARRFPGAQVQRFQATVREPAVEGGRHGADGVLEEREPGVEAGGVEGRGPHQHILRRR